MHINFSLMHPLLNFVVISDYSHATSEQQAQSFNEKRHSSLGTKVRLVRLDVQVSMYAAILSVNYIVIFYDCYNYVNCTDLWAMDL